MSLELNSDIKWVNVEDIQVNPNNNNRHSIEQINRLAKIIKYQGQRRPLVVSNRSGLLVCGHGQLEAVKSLGLTTVPVSYQDFNDEQQEYAHMTADNEIARWAELDMHQLKIDTKGWELDPDFLGLDFFKYEQEEESNKNKNSEDQIPDIKKNELGVQFGQVFRLGDHRLMCGDSTSPDMAAILMAGHKADMVFTDPPYGVEYQSSGREKSPKFDQLMNDDKFLDFKHNLVNYSKDDCPWIIWTSHHVYPKWREMYDSHYKSTVIWYKGGGGMGDLMGDYATDYEMALFCRVGKPKFKNGRPMAVWEIGKDASSSYLHPTQKPVDLAAHAFDHFTGNGDLVMDLFLGSGSTLIAAEKTERKCYGMELDPHYCSVIIKRWQDYTGQTAELISG